MIIVLLLLFQSLCLYCQRLVLHIHDRCFPRNVRLLQEVAETVGDRKAQQHLEQQEIEQHKRRQKRRILEPILPLGAGANLEACRFCAHSPQGYCRHHFHLQELQLQRGNNADYKQQRRIKRELKRTLEQQQQQTQLRSYRPPLIVANSPSCSSLSSSSGYGTLSNCSNYDYLDEQLQVEVTEEEQEEVSPVPEVALVSGNLVTSHL
ncbi:uncharacterized protein Dwil_GK24857 [Drosophila willistoni]|uniref:Uncharacterized protein n=1 Tax=Drosophila willistoni TaxID=7260 RepID=B4N110_DROWI|nr:uncharacterized protein LOC6644159 [Drosophila willistoni]EDW78172.1 uncharacterized protein Dwil_GK24857 [Drosophila willistoni]